MKTKEFSIDKATYFQITFQKYIRNRILFMILLLSFAIIMIFVDMNLFTLLLIAYAVLYPVLIFLAFTFKFQKSVNPSIFQKRQLILTENELITHLENDNKVSVDLSNIQNIRFNKKYTRAYTTENLFIFIPRKAFDSEQEYKLFINTLKKSLPLKNKLIQ